MSALHAAVHQVLSNLPETFGQEIVLDEVFHQELQAIHHKEPIILTGPTPMPAEDPKFAIARYLTILRDDTAGMRLTSDELYAHVQAHCPNLLQLIKTELIDFQAQPRSIDWSIAEYLHTRGFIVSFDKRISQLSITVGTSSLILKV